MTRFDAYLNFPGNAAEAMEFYRSVFGGELRVVRFGDHPGLGDGLPEADLSLLAHATLTLPDGRLLMGSDVPSKMGPVKHGTSMHTMITLDSADEARRLYDGLSEGAQRVDMALAHAGFAELYASFSDRYGIQWMIYYEGNGGDPEWMDADSAKP